MKTLINIVLTFLFCAIFIFLQKEALGQMPCTVNDASGCMCEDSVSTDCSLLPDITVSWDAVLTHTTSYGTGPIEYSQTGNGANDGRLRVSSSTPNIGMGSLTVRGVDDNGDRWFVCGTDTFSINDPNSNQTFNCPNGGEAKQLIFQRIYHKSGATMTYSDVFAGTMTYHANHGHNHVDDWAVLTLRLEDPNDPNPLNWPIVGNGAKIGFCLMDYGTCSFYNGHCMDENRYYQQGNTLLNGDFANYGLGGGQYNCSQYEQGISSGYTDIYGSHLDGMWIDIPPGTCNGDYWIVSEIDRLDHFLEEDETNNWTAVPFTLTMQDPVGTGTVAISTSALPEICSGTSVDLTATAGTTYSWSTGDTTQTISVTNPGNYLVTVTNNCGTGVSDTLTISQLPSPNMPVTSGVTICSGEDAVLVATANGDPIEWLDANGNTVGTGDSLMLSGMTASQTYTAESYVEAARDSFNVGPADNSFGSGGFFNGDQHLVFDALADLEIRSVKMYADGDGDRDIEIKDYTGLVIYDSTVFLLDGENIVYLNAIIPQGTDHEFHLENNRNCYRNSSSAAYPYTISNLVSITQSSAPNSPYDYYYYFYDWEVVSIPTRCSEFASATVNVIPPPSVSITGLDTAYADNITSVSLTGSPSGGSFTGNGVSGSTFDPSAAGIGQHDITYTYSDGSCEGSYSQSVMVYSSVGISDLILGKSLWSIYPNPATEMITLTADAIPYSGPVKIEVLDIGGRVILNDMFSISGGMNRSLDVHHISPGHYQVKLQLGKTTLFEKLIIH